MKKTLKRLMSVVLVVVMVATLFVGSAFAATSSTKSVTSSSTNTNVLTTFTVTTGKGISYSLGLKKTSITFKNVGSGSFAIYEMVGAGPIFQGSCGPNQSWTFTAKGSGKKIVFKCQKSGGSPKAQVTVSAGSVS